MKVRLKITESRCRSGHHKSGDEFIFDEVCPPLCSELWNNIYPYVFALSNGAVLDYGKGKERCFDASCPDGGRVKIHAEVVEE